jgi:hypothetical protein
MNSRPSKVMPLMEDQMIARQRHPQDWRLTPWRPSAHRHRQEIKTGFIYPDDIGFVLLGFFLIAASAARTTA